MELLAAAAVQAGASTKIVNAVLSAISTEEACKIIMAEDGLLFRTMQIVMEKILHHLRRRADSVSGKLQIECATFTTQLGLLAESEGFKQALAAHVHF